MTRKISGTVIDIDDEGNLVTDISSDQLSDAPRDETVRVTVDEHETFGLFPPDHQQPEMTLVAIISPGNPVVITLVGDNASALLDVKVGAPVVVEW